MKFSLLFEFYLQVSLEADPYTNVSTLLNTLRSVVAYEIFLDDGDDDAMRRQGGKKVSEVKHAFIIS